MDSPICSVVVRNGGIIAAANGSFGHAAAAQQVCYAGKAVPSSLGRADVAVCAASLQRLPGQLLVAQRRSLFECLQLLQKSEDTQTGHFGR